MVSCNTPTIAPVWTYFTALCHTCTCIADYDTATERMCMQRPPSDLQERCDETKYGPYRTVYLCMCYGDLCNSGFRTSAATGLVLAALAALLLR